MKTLPSQKINICFEYTLSYFKYCNELLKISTVRKHTFSHVCPTKTNQPVKLRSLIEVFTVRINVASLSIQNVPSEDFYDTARTSRLIWIFAWRAVCFSDVQLCCHIYPKYLDTLTSHQTSAKIITSPSDYLLMQTTICWISCKHCRP